MSKTTLDITKGKGKGGRPLGTLVSPETLHTRRKQVAVERAMGVTVSSIAHKLGVSVPTVNRDLTIPAVKEDILVLRRKIKEVVVGYTAGGLAQKMMELASAKVEEGDAKSVDGMWRAIHAMEKTTQSASGEAQRMEVQGPPPVTAVDLKVLINQIVGTGE